MNNVSYQSGLNMSKRMSESVSEACPKLSERMSERVSNVVYRQNWTWKAARNGKNTTPVQTFGRATTLFFILLSACLTLARMQFIILFECYLATACILIGVDSFQLITRLLAPQSRFLIASCLIGLMAAVLAENNIFWIILTIFGTVTILAIKYLNIEWLNEYNYYCSEAVQRALSDNEESKGMQIWQERGQRETKTLLYELGFTFDETVIQTYCKPVYVLGFYNGFQRTAKAKSRIDKAETQRDEAEKRLEVLQRQLKETKAELKQKRIELNSVTDEHKQLELNYEHVQRLYQATRKELQALQLTNKRLLATNEELLLSMDMEETTPEDLAKDLTIEADKASEDEESRIKAMLLAKDGNGNNLYSMRKIAEKIGCKKWKVEAVKKQLTDVNQGNNITVIGM